MPSMLPHLPPLPHPNPGSRQIFHFPQVMKFPLCLALTWAREVYPGEQQSDTEGTGSALR